MTGTGSAPEVRRAARRGRLSTRDMTGDGRDGEGRWIDFAGAEENGELYYTHLCSKPLNGLPTKLLASSQNLCSNVIKENYLRIRVLKLLLTLH